jgi:hypothetical protein
MGIEIQGVLEFGLGLSLSRRTETAESPGQERAGQEMMMITMPTRRMESWADTLSLITIRSARSAGKRASR